MISGKGDAYRWRLNVPASTTGTAKQRLFFRTEAATKTHRDSLLEAHKAVGDDVMAQLKDGGMNVAQAIAYSLKHPPRAKPVNIEEIT